MGRYVDFHHEDLKIALAGFVEKFKRMPKTSEGSILFGPPSIRGKKWSSAINKLRNGNIVGLEDQKYTALEYYSKYCADLNYEEAMKNFVSHKDSDVETPDDDVEVQFNSNGKPVLKDRKNPDKPDLTRTLVEEAITEHKNDIGSYPRVGTPLVRGNRTFSGDSVLANSKWLVEEVDREMQAGNIPGIDAQTTLDDFCGAFDVERMFQAGNTSNKLSARAVFAGVSSYIAIKHCLPDVDANPDDILIEADPETGQAAMSVRQVDEAFKSGLVEHFKSASASQLPDCLEDFMVARGLAVRGNSGLEPSPDIVLEKPLDPAA